MARRETETEWHTVITIDYRRKNGTQCLRPMFAKLLPTDCPFCHETIWPDQAWHIDHIIPRGYGGDDDLNNLRPAHAACNIRAGKDVVAGRKRVSEPSREW